MATILVKMGHLRVQTVKISFADKTDVVMFDNEKTGIAALTAATTNAGFPARLQENKRE